MGDAAESAVSDSTATATVALPARVPRIQSISAAIALLGSLLAIVVPVTTAIVEIYKTRRELAIESSKNSKELALKDKELEQNITMECLKLAVSKDTAASDRRKVLQAILAIETPLRGWAKDRLAELDQEAAVADLQTAEIQQGFAKADKRSVKAVVASESVSVLQAKIRQDKDNPVELNHDWQLLIAARASSLEVESITEAGGTPLNTGGRTGISKTDVNSKGNSGRIELTEAQVTVEDVAKIMPHAKVDDIRKNLPLVLSALRQFKMMDRTMILVTLAEINWQSGQQFRPLVEGEGRFNTSPGGMPFDLYDHMAILGNLGPPDGERFRGRGYLQVTGRANYARLSAKLGLGNALIDTPEEAADPRIAAQLLVLYLNQNETKFRLAAEAGDFAAIQRMFSGGVTGVSKVKETYEAGDKVLPR